MNRPNHSIGRRGFLKRAAACGLVTLAPGAAWANAEKLFLRVKASLPEDPGGPRPISFGVIADTHSGDLDDTPRPRYFRSSVGNVEETVRIFNRQQLNFAIHLGDVIQESHERSTSLAWMSELDAAFGGFEGPRHYVLGNHDLGDLSKDEFFSATSSTFKEPHYYFDKNGYRFIVLDPNFRQDGVPYHRGNFEWTDTSIPKPQMAWLEATLDSAREAGLPVIVFSHQCLDNASENHRIKNSAEVRSLLESKRIVAAVFYGHRHAGGYFNIKGIHYVNLVATVNGADKAAGIVRITGDGMIEVEGLGERQPDWGPFAATEV